MKYRASRDGFSSENWSSKCNGIRNTLTIIKSNNGNVFGGFTEKGCSTGQVIDPNAFIFSLINEEEKPFKAMFSNTHDGYKNYSTYGQSFGYNSSGYYDIYIASNSNTNQSCSSDLGYSYRHPEYQAGTTRALSILAGSQKFQTVEIEVFAKAN